MTDLQTVLDDIAAEMATRTDRGEPATYIPELAKVDPQQFGIAVALADGSVCVAGDAATAFSIQSVSKVFTLTLALGKVGDALWKRVGREPSGDPFNSIVQLEQRAGIPRNPFINAGAIVVTDTVLSSGAPSGAIAEIVAFLRMLSEDDSVSIDEAVAHSEAETGHRNFALARFMKSYGNLSASADAVLDVYFHQCAIAMSCRQLARAGCFLALGGQSSPGGSCVVSEERARRVNALMMMCGHYDGSGDFAFHVGLPGKSGVGGGILAIVPDMASIAVWSPGLNAVGNSKLGSEALEMLTARMGWSVFT